MMAQNGNSLIDKFIKNNWRELGGILIVVVLLIGQYKMQTDQLDKWATSIDGKVDTLQIQSAQQSAQISYMSEQIRWLRDRFSNK